MIYLLNELTKHTWGECRGVQMVAVLSSMQEGLVSELLTQKWVKVQQDIVLVVCL